MTVIDAATRAELAAIAEDKRRLRAARVLEYVCRRCGETVLSVLETTTGLVVCGRIVQDFDEAASAREIRLWIEDELAGDPELVSPYRPGAVTVADPAIIAANIKARAQSGRIRAATEIYLPLHGDHDDDRPETDEAYRFDCRCKRAVGDEIPAGDVLARLARGVQKVTWLTAVDVESDDIDTRQLRRWLA